MKKFLLLFILLLLTAFKASYAQLPFYEFVFNVYDESGQRIADTNLYKVTHKAILKGSYEIDIFEQIKPSTDTLKTYGYDYRIINGGARLYNYTVEIIIERMEDDIAQDVMWIEFDNPKANIHTMLGLDKIVFKPGKFIFTNENWPKNRRDSGNRYFSFIDENFDWNKIKEE